MFSRIIVRIIQEYSLCLAALFACAMRIDKTSSYQEMFRSEYFLCLLQDSNGDRSLIAVDKELEKASYVPVAIGRSPLFSLTELPYCSLGDSIWVLCGSGAELSLMASSDRGGTWSETAIDGKALFTHGSAVTRRIGFTSPTLGWLALSHDVSAGSQKSYLYITSDGGLSWKEMPGNNSSYPSMLAGACLFSENDAVLYYEYKGGASSKAYVTNDGGGSWSPILLSIALKDGWHAAIDDVKFSEGRTVMRVEVHQGESVSCLFAVSSDFGRTWEMEKSAE
jgi:photosystem II stability/assembly factor-like uncharacterized protein